MPEQRVIRQWLVESRRQEARNRVTESLRRSARAGEDRAETRVAASLPDQGPSGPPPPATVGGGR
jgi:hypothetical protein